MITKLKMCKMSREQLCSILSLVCYRATFFEAILVDILSCEYTVYKKLQQSQISSGELGVLKVMEVFHNFTISFLKESKDELLCLSSGTPASNKIKDDLLK